MKTSNYLLLIFCLLSMSSVKAGTGKLLNNSFVYENSLMKQVISFENNMIRLESVFDKSSQTELFSTSDIPYFEFVVNKKTVNALMPIWKFTKLDERKLNNGGTEYVFHFEGKGACKGLVLELFRQYFENSTLTRERLQLKASPGSSFRLNKKNGELHFIYPQLNIKQKRNIQIQEIQIANYFPWAHTFRPSVKDVEIKEGETLLLKGPLTIAKTETHKIISTYEHASQDGANGFRLSEITSKNKDDIDASQGVKGDDTIITDEDFWFIGHRYKAGIESHILSTEMLRGGYFDSEKISQDSPYETVWNSFSFVEEKEEIEPVIRNYLLNQITEHPKSRESHFYYNTWGMQRESQKRGHDVRGVFTEERILQEIDYAAEMGVELFVLDDGWEQAHGVWTYNTQRLPNGLEPLVSRMREQNMIPGIWFSPMGIDSLSERFKSHQDWVVRRADGRPILAQWDQPVFDFVGPFSKVFLEDCKKLIDQGIRYFKWDAINTFNSALPNLYHGTDKQTKKERIDRYNYLLPFYVTQIMKEIRAYNSDVLIEIDLTEPERCLIGLMPLQEAKFFFMNNGASAYGDYSTYRTKSMRTVINEYGTLFPKELFTYAVYPHNASPYRAQQYNINTTLIAGNGTWGDLSLMAKADRERVDKLFSKAKRVRPYIHGKKTHYSAKVGGTPEVYTQVDAQNTFGQVIAFSGSAIKTPYTVAINQSKLLGVLNHPYTSANDNLLLTLDFTRPDDTKEAFILGNLGENVSVVSSTGWLDDIALGDNTLTIKVGSASTLRIDYRDKKITRVIDGVITKQETNSAWITAEAGSSLLVIFEDLQQKSVTGVHGGKGEKQQVNSWEKQTDALRIETSGGMLLLQPHISGSIHIQYGDNKRIKDYTSFAVTDKPQVAPFDVKEEKGLIALTTDRFHVTISKEDGHLAFYDRSGNLLVKEYPTEARYNLSGDSVKAFCKFQLNEKEAIYGLGQFRDGKLSLRNTSRELIQFNTQAAVPVIYSTNGWGIFWDNPSRTVYTDNQEGLSFTSDYGTIVDYYLFVGDSLDELITSYRRLTGEAPMLADWALGFHQSRNKYATQHEVMDVAKRMREEDIPMSSVFIDYYYWEKYGTGSHRFDETLFPNVKNMLDSLHTVYGTKVVLTIWPTFRPGIPNHEELAQNGLILEGAKALDGFIYDAFNPKASELYWKQVLPLVNQGIDGWFLDGPEPDQPTSFLPTMTYAGPAGRVRNLYPLVHATTFYNGLLKARPNKRPYILTRCAWASQQKIGTAIWSGDIPTTFEELEIQVAAGLNFTATGIPYWTTDIGGYQGGDPANSEYRELFTRWFQYGTFCPVFRSHGRRYPGDRKTPNELWAYGAEVQRICTDFINLRYALFPYIYSLTGDVTQKNYTPMRLMAFDFPEDENVLDCKDQFMYGPAFLVCPILKAGINKRMVYLPKGKNWIDYWTGQNYTGGKTIDADAPIDKMPLFVQAGAIIPVYPSVQKHIARQNPMEIHVYEGSNGYFELYEDDGETLDYERGRYSRIPFSWNEAEKTLTIENKVGEFGETERDFHVICKNKAKEDVRKSARYNGKEMIVKM